MSLSFEAVDALNAINKPKKPNMRNVGRTTVCLTYKSKKYVREFRGHVERHFYFIAGPAEAPLVVTGQSKALEFIHAPSPFIEIADGHFVPRASVSAVRVETRDHWVSSPGGSEKETK